MTPFSTDPTAVGWKQYILYPRVLLTLILCGAMLMLHVAYGIYAWYFER